MDGGLRFRAYGNTLDDYEVEWHEADLGGEIAAILVVHRGVVYCEVERSLMASPSAWLLRPWAARQVATGWPSTFVTMKQFRAATTG